jgi:hypothetical protein
MAAFEKEGIEFAYPMQSVQIRSAIEEEKPSGS